ncbi:MAG TPA: diguanylate cyclase [Flexistipes sinusarabici]|uniref:diguanylate cyclase n=2 Tax=Flexistipes sinusarabici TaxID=2352 RepID=A0A3D5QDH5_FLESI|nr:diguanylate cyclase [Flexistipes sinusarabici]
MNSEENGVFKKLFDLIPFYAYVVDMESYEILYMNTKLQEKIGDNLNGKCYKVLYGYDKPCIFCKIGELYSKEAAESGKSVVHEEFNDVDEKWYRLEERAIYWPGDKIAKYSFAIDISNEKESQNKLAEAHANLMLQSRELESKNALLHEMYEKAKDMSEKDYLTGLYNRRYFQEIGSKLISNIIRQRDIPAYFAMLDIDHFKIINDEYGHGIGDEVLKHFARMLEASFRSSDLVGRLGGEEFGIILINVDYKDAVRLLEGLRQKIENQKLNLNGAENINYTISIGAVKVRNNEMNTLLANADSLMYQAKREGRNRLVIEKE